ncbi:HD domain-containing protein [Synoicihabitans lomoniglobus]|uniref:HD domain-containing protein n=1 Tax=Synoicihabitans lomoniglobus TaxID=2909285 RepID=A0AAE9ZVS0_9BACT|nr:HD domain-containing protein [Opitutaceae bacterium LMO-M01]WED65086.1 HD domain-containing protein [Opitutaceae bacterium LMO-M01]
MPLPDRAAAHALLERQVQDPYQRHHALMVGTALVGYARHFGEDEHLWYLTGLLHDLDYEQFPETHPTESLKWFAEWGYPEELIHAVEAHAYGYNNYKTLPRTRLAAALLACDELCGIFYAYRKLNPVPYGQMKAKSLRKKFKEPSFAAKVDRSVIELGCEHLAIPIPDHIANLITFLAPLE